MFEAILSYFLNRALKSDGLSNTFLFGERA